MTEKERAIEAASIKKKSRKSRDEWETLDAGGLQDVPASYVQRKISRLERELKEINGEDY
jgi:hypothetical protein